MADPQAPRGVRVFGSVNMDLVVRVPAIPRPGETVLAPGYATHAGGKGANQAVAAARYGRDSGVPVAFTGRIGPDGFGEALKDTLGREGIELAGLRIGAQPTGCAFITVDDAGENAITVASGANAELAAADLPDLAGAAVLVLQMETPLPASLDAARRARAAGAAVIWSLAPVPADLDAAALRAVLAAASLLLVNEGEAEAAALLLGLPESREPGRDLACTGTCKVVVTRGASGASGFLPGGGEVEASSLPVEALDTTGAGDTFAGILAVEHALGTDLPTALRRACAGAALACTAAGAQAGMPTRTDVLARLGDE